MSHHDKISLLTLGLLAGLFVAPAPAAATNLADRAAGALRAHDGPDGEIAARRKDVRVQPDSEGDWHDAAVGEKLHKQGRVNTLEGATAVVTFRDDSHVSLRENTLLIIYGHHALRKASIIAMEAELERGALRARLGELSGGRKAGIDTPGGRTSMEGGESLIKVDDEGTSRVANHGDGKTSVKGKRGGKVALDKGKGVKVKKNKRPERPKPLPATPKWNAGPERFLAVSGKIGTLGASWAAVTGAHSYVVEVSSDPEGRDVLATVEVPGDVDRFEIHGLPAATYYATVAAVDDDQFESIPSTRLALTLDEVELRGPGGAQVMWAEGPGPDLVARALPGSVMVLPDDIRCGLDSDQLRARPTLVEAGERTLVCQTSSGAEVSAFPVVVEPVALAASSEGSFELVAGQTIAWEVSVESELPLPDALEAAGSPGLKILEIERIAPDRWRLLIAADPDARGVGEIALSMPGVIDAEAEAASPSEEGVSPGEEGAAQPEAQPAQDPVSGADVSEPFARLEVALLEPPVEVAPTPERHMIEIGVGGGVMVASRNHGLLGPDALARQELARPAGQGTLRVGYYPLRYVGLDLDLRLTSAEGAESGARAFLWGLRGEVVGQLPYRVTPYIALGAGALGVASSVDALGDDQQFSGTVGGGLKVFITDRVLFRLGMRDVIAAGVDGAAHHFELDLGLGVVLRRRSAGRR